MNTLKEDKLLRVINKGDIRVGNFLKKGNLEVKSELLEALIIWIEIIMETIVHIYL